MTDKGLEQLARFALGGPMTVPLFLGSTFPAQTTPTQFFMALTRIGIDEEVAKAVSVREDLFSNGENLDSHILAQKLNETYIPRLKHLKLIK